MPSIYKERERRGGKEGGREGGRDIRSVYRRLNPSTPVKHTKPSPDRTIDIPPKIHQ